MILDLQKSLTIPALMSTFAFFSTQNSQLLIYLINYSLIYEAIPPKSNPIQAINPMNLHTKLEIGRPVDSRCE